MRERLKLVAGELSSSRSLPSARRSSHAYRSRPIQRRLPAAPSASSSPWCNSICIRTAMHPRWRRCSSLKYSRYSQSSRLAIGAPRRSRCDDGLAPRAARARAARSLDPQTHAAQVGDVPRIGVEVFDQRREIVEGRRAVVVGLGLPLECSVEVVRAGIDVAKQCGGTYRVSARPASSSRMSRTLSLAPLLA